MSKGIEEVQNYVVKYKYKILIAIGALLVIVGIILLASSGTKTNINTNTFNYTYCIKATFEDLDPITCRDALLDGNKDCLCNIEVNITKPMLGPVILYYELPDLQMSAEYKNSRDDYQLRGVVSQTPSEKCEPFRYNNIDGVKTPIVPCGEVADKMFTDNFRLAPKNTFNKVPLQRFGMLSSEDKSGFQNPENLRDAFQNFSKPKSWSRPIWELDTDNENNNGFQNEPFISWMRTDWKRKPVACLNQTDPTYEKGLPAGIYLLSINYNYSPSWYDGSRLVILQSVLIESSNSHYGAGVILLILGLLLLIGGASPYILKYIQKRRNRAQETVVKPSESSTETPQVQSESPFLNQN